MKKTILTIGLVFLAFIANAQLNSNANFIKGKRPVLYSQIKNIAGKQWEGDHQMMVYVINQQSDALMEFLEIKKGISYDEKIMDKAINEWTENIEGEYCTDYVMVIYVYKQQFKAKGSY